MSANPDGPAGDSERVEPTTDELDRLDGVISLTTVREMDQLAAIRRFNRTYTPKIGALGDSFLGSGLPLPTARLLYEVGPDGATVRELRRKLGLDSGYLSRLLRSLETDRLIMLTDDPTDRRRRICRLTASGKRRWSRLDARSDEIVADLLAPFTTGQRERLVNALSTAALLIDASTVVFHELDPASPEATAALMSYFDELDARFSGGFDRSDALGEGVSTMTPPRGTFLAAFADDGTVVGCGGVQAHDDITAEVKRMWIHADWRGVGLGRRLLAALEQHGAALGYTSVVLDTNATLTEAIAMYEAAGYAPTERYNDNPYAHRWFTKPLHEPPSNDPQNLSRERPHRRASTPTCRSSVSTPPTDTSGSAVSEGEGSEIFEIG